MLQRLKSKIVGENCYVVYESTNQIFVRGRDILNLSKFKLTHTLDMLIRIGRMRCSISMCPSYVYMQGEMDRLMKETETLQHQARAFKVDADQFAMALQQQQEENRELKTEVRVVILHSTEGVG